MKVLNIRYINVFIVLIITNNLYGLIPFNPIINPESGNPFKFEGDERKGIIGWLDVPPHKDAQGNDVSFDRVLALQDEDGWIHYIHPADPNEKLPKGFFSWQSQWKAYASKFLRKYAKENYRGLRSDYEYLKQMIYNRSLSDFGLKNQPTDKSFLSYKNNAWQGSSVKPKFTDPSRDVSLFFKWQSLDDQNRRLFRPWAFYHLMGVTEQYMREFMGSDTQELLKQPSKRDNKLVFMPSIADMNKSFPLHNKNFPNRKLIDPKNHSLTSFSNRALKQLANKTLSGSGSLGLAKVVVHDGYEIFQQTNDQQKAMKASDIRFLMANPYFKDAAIMAASTLDGLEGGISDSRALVSEMQWTPTQGEEIALVAGLAIWIKYYAKKSNMLEAVNKARLDKYGKLTGFTTALTEQDIPDINAIVHKNVMVTSGYYPSYFLTKQKLSADDQERLSYIRANNITDPKRDPINIFNTLLKDSEDDNDTRTTIGTEGDQYITVLLTSALNLIGKENDPVYEKSAKVILKAMYQNALYAAIAMKKRKIVLTLLGAGAFKNKLSWIGDILSSDEIASIIKKAGLEVHVVIYPDFRAGKKFDVKPYNSFKENLQTLKKKISK